ncbi:ABC transporter substrate-binding protein [Oecophyllibacter saccharovorans]|uniref:ABC transporter substrate-binding protein n=1 Tax=Oecophyllibacter saccharovorans TaxID=2558360 RepID=UPI001E51782B|nr:ABC transporter substrate-binding protein [Oecophyllibacter saccharovorans]
MRLDTALRALKRACLLAGGSLVLALGAAWLPNSWGLSSLSASLIKAAGAREVTDILGRHVTVPDHPKRIVLGEGRLIYALQPLEGDNPFSRVVGWQGEFRTADTQNYDELRKRHPEAEQVAVIGRTSADTISPEKVLDLHPDLAVFSTSGHGPGQSSAVTQRLESAHIPVIFVDFRADPVAHTVPSMHILGQALDRPQEAKAYTDFYQSRLDLIQQATSRVPAEKRPTVFIDMLAGTRSCCHTAGKGNMGAFIEAAGGRNIAAPLLPGFLGEVSAETLITRNPDVLILDGTRGPGHTGPGLKLGAQVTPAVARQSLDSLLQAPELSELKAVRSGRSYGLWHSFYDSPFNILAIEAMAKWFYPGLLPDLNPEADLHEISTRFHGLPASGTYWTAAGAP